jgi:hypothetical protein
MCRLPPVGPSPTTAGRARLRTRRAMLGLPGHPDTTCGSPPRRPPGHLHPSDVSHRTVPTSSAQQARRRVGRAERHPPLRGVTGALPKGTAPLTCPLATGSGPNAGEPRGRFESNAGIGTYGPTYLTNPAMRTIPRLQARGGDTVDQRAITAHAHRSHDSCRRRPAPGRRTSGRRPPRGRPDWRLNDVATASDPSDHARYGRAIRGGMQQVIRVRAESVRGSCVAA